MIVRSHCSSRGSRSASSPAGCTRCWPPGSDALLRRHAGRHGRPPGVPVPRGLPHVLRSTTLLGIDPLLTMVVTAPLFFVIGVVIQRFLLARLAPESMTMMSVLLTFAIAVLIEGAARRRSTPGSYRSITVEYAHQVVRPVRHGPAVRPSDRVRDRRPRRCVGAVRVARGHPLRPGAAGDDPAPGGGQPGGHRHRADHRLRLRDSGWPPRRSAAPCWRSSTPFFPAGHWGYIGKLMAIIVVGGLGSVQGAAIAALLLGRASRRCCRSPYDAPGRTLMFFVFLFGTLWSARRGSSEVALPSASRAAATPASSRVAGRARRRRWRSLLLSWPWIAPNSYLRYAGVITIMYAVMATSWNLLGGFTGYVSLGHSAFFGLGGVLDRAARHAWRRALARGPAGRCRADGDLRRRCGRRRHAGPRRVVRDRVDRAGAR